MVHGDEVPLLGSDLDLGKQGEKHLLMNFLVTLGRYPHQRYGIVCHPLGLINNRSIEAYPLQFIRSNFVRPESRTFSQS